MSSSNDQARHAESTAVKSFTVTLNNGSHVEYTMRGLREDEISKWAAFCASVFSYKANPPPASYFERHYVRDPQRGDASLIRVVVYQEDMLVSSCRIFPRRISNGDASFWRGGGIGEVCTDSRHQRRGLSKLLLQDAIRIMKEHEMQISLLHAASDFFPFYKSVGYSCSHSKWSVATVYMNLLLDTVTTTAATSQRWIRLADFPKDTERLHAIHQVYSEQRFAGCILRSTDYWNEYICHELEGSLWLLVEPLSSPSDNSDATDDDKIVVAWISLRQRGDRYQVREFGCDEKRISTLAAFPKLLQHALPKLDTTSASVDGKLNLHLPTFLIIGMGGTEALDWLSNNTPEDDHGWMYKSLGEDFIAPLLPPPSKEHLIWPSDSF